MDAEPRSLRISSWVNQTFLTLIRGLITCTDFTSRLEKEGIQINMNGQGRVFENIFVEQLWQPMKQEDIYLKNYTSGSELTTRINKYFLFYNQE